MRSAMLRGAAMIAGLAVPSLVLAQDNVVAIATLPRDLSPGGMYINAEAVVRAVLIGLAFASVVTWTVWLAKSMEIFFAKRQVRAAMNRLASLHSILYDFAQFAEIRGEVGQFLAA